MSIIFQSTHPVGGATGQAETVTAKLAISIHAPRGGCDLLNGDITLGARNFNPRTPWGVRPYQDAPTFQHAQISIHAPRGGCDFPFACLNCSMKIFQSTHPVGGATAYFGQGRRGAGDFNPRTPWGVRRVRSRPACVVSTFQSTHPVGGATWSLSIRRCVANYFNPRTPWGVRRPTRAAPPRQRYFNPRTPWGVRPARERMGVDGEYISIHAPRGGCDKSLEAQLADAQAISIHAPRGGCD